MKAFITGISGFVGANFARFLLQKGARVSGFVRNPQSIWRLEKIAEEIAIYQGDLLDREAIRKAVLQCKPDVIFHFGVYDYLKIDLEQIFAVGAIATHHLLIAAKEANVKMFVNIGSSSEYGSKNHPMREDESIEPNSYYAIGKAAQSHLVSYFSKREKMPAVTLRLFSVYGPFEDNSRFIPTLIRCALANQNMPLVPNLSGRDFIYVEDVCAACEKASEKILYGNVINIGTGVQSTLMDAFHAIKNITQSTMEVQIGAYENREFDTAQWVADPTAAKTLIAFEAKTTLVDGLKKTVDWFQKKSKIQEIPCRLT